MKKAAQKIVRQVIAKTNSLNAPIAHKKCNLIVVRERMGVSQPEMAVKMGLSPSGLWKIEQGTAVKLNVARKIAKFYGKSIDELWPEELEQVPEDCGDKPKRKRPKDRTVRAI